MVAGISMFASIFGFFVVRCMAASAVLLLLISGIAPARQRIAA